MVVAEPGIPDWALRLIQRLDEEYAPLTPRSPVGVPAYATADLPPASAFPNRIAYDKTVGAIVFSDGSAWV